MLLALPGRPARDGLGGVLPALAEWMGDDQGSRLRVCVVLYDSSSVHIQVGPKLAIGPRPLEKPASGKAPRRPAGPGIRLPARRPGNQPVPLQIKFERVADFRKIPRKMRFGPAGRRWPQSESGPGPPGWRPGPQACGIGPRVSEQGASPSQTLFLPCQHCQDL